MLVRRPPVSLAQCSNGEGKGGIGQDRDGLATFSLRVDLGRPCWGTGEDSRGGAEGAEFGTRAARPQRSLPGCRADLYQRCVQVLVEEWRKDLVQRSLVPMFDGQAAVDVLGSIAWWLHSEGQRTSSSTSHGSAYNRTGSWPWKTVIHPGPV